ncbi:hypothetical protein RUM43_008298 [Polyplax serrata]|uniref:Uncharacterized protein n=1 Tax=Polyplax serrata TaxID=468196 RepID=A0AAN8SAC3_POLSC
MSQCETSNGALNERAERNVIRRRRKKEKIENKKVRWKNRIRKSDEQYSHALKFKMEKQEDDDYMKNGHERKLERGRGNVSNKLTKAAEYSSMVEKTLRVEVNDEEMVAQKEDILTEKATSVGRLKLQ